MEFSIDTNNVLLEQQNQVESGEYNVTECSFIFSSEYEGLTKKAVFTGEDGIAYLQTIVDGKCFIPSEILEVSQVVEIGVYAYDVENEELVLRYSPEPTQFYIHQGSYKEAQNSTPPTPSEIEQLQSQITANANNIEELEDDVEVLENDVEVLKQNYGKYDTAIEDLQNDVEDLQENYGKYDDDIAELKDDVEILQENYGKYDDDITNLQDDVSNIKTEQITQNTNIQKNTHDIEVLQQNYGQYDTDIANLQDDVSDIKAEQVTQNTNISANANAITNLQSTKADKTEIPTKISDLVNDSDFIEDADYVHTDNNFTDEDEAQITTNKNNIATLQSTKADKTEIPISTSDLTNDSGFIDKSVNDLTNYTKTTDLSAVALSGSYEDLSNKPSIPSKTSQLTNDSGFINKNVNDLTNYTLKTNTGSLIDLEINSTTYVITLSLKNQDGTVISTDTIDLPLESVVVGGRYDSANQKIVLTLENGNIVDIPVGDLIAGLQTEITSQNKLASDLVDDTNSGNKFVTTSEKQTWNTKYDKPVGGIPKTDLSSDVQTSLSKADSAIQEHQDLTDYVKNTDYASASKGGTFKLGARVSIGENGSIVAETANYSTYVAMGNGSFISKGTLENVITGKELVNKTYVDDIVGDIESILEELDIGNGVSV